MLNLVLPNEQAHRLDGILNGPQKLSCTEKQQPDSYNDPNQNQRRKVKERRGDIYQRQLHAFTDFYMALGEEHAAEAAVMVMEGQIVEAMNRYNGMRPEENSSCKARG